MLCYVLLSPVTVTITITVTVAVNVATNITTKNYIPPRENSKNNALGNHLNLKTRFINDFDASFNFERGPKLKNHHRHHYRSHPYLHLPRGDLRH